MTEPEGPFLVKFHHEVGRSVTQFEYDLFYRKVLLNGISAVAKVFLDTNFWVWLRDANDAGNSDKDTLLRRLREGARTRRFTCVFHLGSFMEFVKQQDREKLRAVAALADELCEGVCLASKDEQRLVEAWWYASDALQTEFDGRAGFWTHVGLMFKSTFPPSDLPMTQLDRNVVYKSVLDAAHTTTLSRLLEDVGDSSVFAFRLDDSTLAAVEALKKTRQAEGLTRSASRLQAFRDTMEQQYARGLEFHMQRHCAAIGSAMSRDDIRRWVGDMIDKATEEFRTERLGNHLASAAIFSELFALYEVGDPAKRLTSNDWEDWDHAASALPHCDAFFTEAHLASQLNQHNGCASRHQCRVAGSVGAALRVLDDLGV